MNPLDLQLLEFSRSINDTLQDTLEFYPQAFVAAAQITQMPPSPSVEAELMEIRRATSDWANTMAILSRTIANLNASYSQSGLGPEHNPAIIRPLLLDVLESCFLLANVASLGELSELSVMSPDELQARFNHPQVAAWMTQNQYAQASPTQQPLPQPPANSQAPAPIMETAANYPVEAPVSPYPPMEPAEPSPYPSAEPQIHSQPAVPQSPPEPLAPKVQVPDTDPWNQPPAKPSTDGDRSRNRPV